MARDIAAYPAGAIATTAGNPSQEWLAEMELKSSHPLLRPPYRHLQQLPDRLPPAQPKAKQ